MPVLFSVRSSTSKKGTIIWELLDAKGKTVIKDRDKQRVLGPVKKIISQMESWPCSAKELSTEEDWEKAERIAARRPAWESWNFAVAKWRGLMQTKDVAEYLGVSEAWVRNNIRYSEWHHSYKQKGQNGNAFFYDPDNVIAQLARDEAKISRLKRLSYKRYAELCELLGKPADTENLGWYKKVQEYRQNLRNLKG